MKCNLNNDLIRKMRGEDEFKIIDKIKEEADAAWKKIKPDELFKTVDKKDFMTAILGETKTKDIAADYIDTILNAPLTSKNKVEKATSENLIKAAIETHLVAENLVESILTPQENDLLRHAHKDKILFWNKMTKDEKQKFYGAEAINFANKIDASLIRKDENGKPFIKMEGINKLKEIDPKLAKNIEKSLEKSDAGFYIPEESLDFYGRMKTLDKKIKIAMEENGINPDIPSVKFGYYLTETDENGNIKILKHTEKTDEYSAIDNQKLLSGIEIQKLLDDGKLSYEEVMKGKYLKNASLSEDVLGHTGTLGSFVTKVKKKAQLDIIDNMLKDPDITDTERRRLEQWKKYIAESTSSPYHKVLDDLRTGMFIKYVVGSYGNYYGNVLQAAVNGTMLLASKYSHDKNPYKVTGKTLKALKDLGRLVLSGDLSKIKKLTPDEKDFLGMLQKTGIFEHTWTEEIMPHKGHLKTLGDTLGRAFKRWDVYARMATGLAIYRHLKETTPTMSKNKMIEIALDVARVNGHIGKENTNNLFRGTGKTGATVRTLATFTNFSRQMGSFWRDHFRQNWKNWDFKQKVENLSFLAAMSTAIGGVAAIPGYAIAKTLIDLFGDSDEMEEFMYDMGIPGDLLRGGIPNALLGLDMSRSLKTPVNIKSTAWLPTDAAIFRYLSSLTKKDGTLPVLNGIIPKNYVRMVKKLKKGERLFIDKKNKRIVRESDVNYLDSDNDRYLSIDKKKADAIVSFQETIEKDLIKKLKTKNSKEEVLDFLRDTQSIMSPRVRQLTYQKIRSFNMKNKG